MTTFQRSTQTETLAAAFSAGATISSRDALLSLGIPRLAARVHDLKLQGWTISRTFARDLNGRRFARYSGNAVSA